MEPTHPLVVRVDVVPDILALSHHGRVLALDAHADQVRHLLALRVGEGCAHEAVIGQPVDRRRGDDVGAYVAALGRRLDREVDVAVQLCRRKRGHGVPWRRLSRVGQVVGVDLCAGVRAVVGLRVSDRAPSQPILSLVIADPRPTYVAQHTGPARVDQNAPLARLLGAPRHALVDRLGRLDPVRVGRVNHHIMLGRLLLEQGEVRETPPHRRDPAVDLGEPGALGCVAHEDRHLCGLVGLEDTVEGLRADIALG